MGSWGITAFDSDAGLDAVFTAGQFSHFISDECQGHHFTDKATLIAALAPLVQGSAA